VETKKDVEKKLKTQHKGGMNGKHFDFVLWVQLLLYKGTKKQPKKLILLLMVLNSLCLFRRPRFDLIKKMILFCEISTGIFHRLAELDSYMTYLQK